MEKASQTGCSPHVEAQEWYSFRPSAGDSRLQNESPRTKGGVKVKGLSFMRCCDRKAPLPD
jgi:hypothetical protein